MFLVWCLHFENHYHREWERDPSESFPLGRIFFICFIDQSGNWYLFVCLFVLNLEVSRAWVKESWVSESCSVMSNSLQHHGCIYIVHGILQARILKWIAVTFSKGSSNSGIKPRSPALQMDFLPVEPQGKPKDTGVVAYPFSRGSSWPRNWTEVLCIASRFFNNWTKDEGVIWRQGPCEGTESILNKYLFNLRQGKGYQEQESEVALLPHWRKEKPWVNSHNPSKLLWIHLPVTWRMLRIAVERRLRKPTKSTRAADLVGYISWAQDCGEANQEKTYQPSRKSMPWILAKMHSLLKCSGERVLFAWKVKMLVAQSHPPLCDPIDCSLPGSSVYGIL